MVEEKSVGLGMMGDNTAMRNVAFSGVIVVGRKNLGPTIDGKSIHSNIPNLYRRHVL